MKDEVGALRLTRWQVLTLVTLCLGYAGYYLCRSDLSVVAPLLLADRDLNLSKQSLGLIISASVYAYAAGKIISGPLVDLIGGRKVFLGGMLGAMACTVAFRCSDALVFFILFWAINRFIQSVGWSALVKIATNWFNHHQYGRIMGILSLSFLFGDAIGRFYLGQLIKWGWGWKAILMAATLSLGVICVLCYLTVREHPERHQIMGALEPEANPDNLFAQETEEPRGFWQLFRPLLTSDAFWCVAIMCAGQTLIRETFNFWLPQYLAEVAGMSQGQAGQYSALFPLCGGFSVIFFGWLSDRALKGRRGAILAVTTGILSLCLLAMGLLPTDGSPTLPVLLVCVVALLQLGPYCFLGGAMAMEMGGKKGSATASGLIYSAGYMAGALAGAAGAVAERGGWPMAFATLAGVSLVTCVAGVVFALRHEHGAKPLPAPSEPPEVESSAEGG